MSQDKRRLFGSRISSIFSSNDSHHHLKSSERNSSPRSSSRVKTPEGNAEPVWPSSPSQSQASSTTLSKDSPQALFSSSSHNLRHAKSKGSNLSFAQAPETTRPGWSMQDLTSKASEAHGNKNSLSGLHDIRSSRTKLTRKPPPDAFEDPETSKTTLSSEVTAELTSANQFEDVITTLEQEIGQMNDEADRTTGERTKTRPNISQLPSSEQTSPLKVTRTIDERDLLRSHVELGNSNDAHSIYATNSKLIGPRAFDESFSCSSESPSEQSQSKSSFKDQCIDTVNSSMYHNERNDGSDSEHSAMVPISDEFRISGSENGKSFYSTKSSISDESNRRSISPTDGHPYPAEDGKRVVDQLPMFGGSNSSSITGPTSLNNWDVISESANEDHSGALDEMNRQSSLISSALNSNIGTRSENTKPVITMAPQTRTHTRMSSTSSVYSAGSNRHVSLATLKMAYSLRPGEGEKSAYVDTIRKSAGTSFNEAGPGKWRLPTGIMPVDKREIMQQSSKMFNRGVRNTGYRSKKSSGVELKHGHLQPRLLAAEVDEGDNTNRFGALGRSSTLQHKSLTPVTSKSSTPSTGLNGVSRTNSLERANTIASVSTTGDLQSSTSSISNSRRGSTLSFAESVGSINNDRNVDIYYQHQGFKFEDEDDSSNVEEYSHHEGDNMFHDSEDSEGEKPRLFLANPDSDSN